MSIDSISDTITIVIVVEIVLITITIEVTGPNELVDATIVVVILVVGPGCCLLYTSDAADE